MEPKAIYYHGSYDELPEGSVMKGRGDAYEASWKDTDFYPVLERYRPEGCLAHRDAVFMVESIDDIDNAGGATDWVLEVAPVGETTRHDMSWSSEISCLLSDGHAVESAEVAKAADNYWRGVVHADGPLWEVIAREAVVVAAYEFDDAPPSPSFGRL